MQNDLISRSAFIEFVRNLPKTENGYSRQYDESDILHYINEQPTAYDVEKVVEQLQQQANQYNRRALELVEKSTEAGIHNKGKACSYEHAIEIVRTCGGSNECEDNYCEWKKPQNMRCCIGYHNGVSFLIEHYMLKQFKHCPFCGKFINILEVE